MNEVTLIHAAKVSTGKVNFYDKYKLFFGMFDQLRKGLSTLPLATSDTNIHKSFLDENLLDIEIGPEISRTLRR